MVFGRNDVDVTGERHYYLFITIYSYGVRMYLVTKG